MAIVDLRDSMIDGNDSDWLPEYVDLLCELERIVQIHTDAEPGSDAMLATLDDLIEFMNDYDDFGNKLSPLND